MSVLAGSVRVFALPPLPSLTAVAFPLSLNAIDSLPRLRSYKDSVKGM